MNACRTCGAPIIWARTAKNKAIPLDAEPSELEANVSLGEAAFTRMVDDVRATERLLA